jgi:hypothetical protein
LRDTYPLHNPERLKAALKKKEQNMAAMKPRTGDGPMEVTKEARSFVMRIPLEGGGRLVVELNVEEATNLGNALQAAVSLVKK